jgi:hypothetical protein
MMLCVVTNGSVMSCGKMYRKGSEVELDDSEAKRCIKLGVVEKKGTVSTPKPGVTVSKGKGKK